MMRTAAALTLCLAISQAFAATPAFIDKGAADGSWSTCADGNCQCVDEPERPRSDQALGKQLEIVTKSGKKSMWKMKERWNALGAKDVKYCGSCDFDRSYFREDNELLKFGLKDAEKAKSETQQEVKPIEWKKIFYISLEESYDRRGALYAQDLESFAQGIPLEHFVAVDRTKAAATDLSKYAPKGLAQYVADYGDHSKWGTIAVYLSHVQLMEKIYNEDPDGEGLYLIMEDDAKLGGDRGYWKRKVEELIQQKKVPEDWDVLKIGYWGDKRCQDFVSDEVVEAKTPGFSDNGEHAFYSGNVAYIVRPKSVPIILEQLKDSPLFDVDGAMMSMHKEGEARGKDGLQYAWTWGAHTYVTKEPLVWGGLGHTTLRMLQTSEKFQKRNKAISALQTDLQDQDVKRHEQDRSDSDADADSDAESDEMQDTPWMDWPEDHPAFTMTYDSMEAQEQVAEATIEATKAAAKATKEATKATVALGKEVAQATAEQYLAQEQMQEKIAEEVMEKIPVKPVDMDKVLKNPTSTSIRRALLGNRGYSQAMVMSSFAQGMFERMKPKLNK